MTKKNIGILLKMTGGIQAPFGCFEEMTNTEQASTKCICNARDLLEASKAAYGVFEKLQTLKDKNTLQHIAIENVRRGLRGGALKT